MATPTSACSSLWMLTNDGGTRTPRRTEKHNPCAWPGSVVRILAEDHHLDVRVRREVQRREHLVRRRVHGGCSRRSAATNCWSSSQYGWSNSLAQQRVPVGGHRPHCASIGRRSFPCLSCSRVRHCHELATTCPRRSSAARHFQGRARLWVKRDDLTGLGGGRQQGAQARVPVRRGGGDGCAGARHRRSGPVEPLPDDGGGRAPCSGSRRTSCCPATAREQPPAISCCRCSSVRSCTSPAPRRATGASSRSPARR